MTQLSVFTSEEIQMLASLPYKAGIYISHADDEEGERDDESESKAFENCIRAMMKRYADKKLIVDLLQETLRRRPEWPQWYEDSFHILKQAPAAVTVLRTKASESDLKNYRAAIMEIASAVAQAYGEFGYFDEDENEGIFSRIIGKFKALDDANHPMNVSAAEDSALSRLAAALKAGK